MTEPVRFFAAGDPKGQPRPRAFVRKMGAQFVARVYDAGTAEGWKGSVALIAREVLSGRVFEGPLAVGLTFYFRRPKGHVNSKGLLRPVAPRFHTSKPDADNAAKAVLDALTQLGAWNDDSQVAELRVRKEYAAPSDPAGALIEISPCVDVVALPERPVEAPVGGLLFEERRRLLTPPRRPPPSSCWRCCGSVRNDALRGVQGEARGS